MDTPPHSLASFQKFLFLSAACTDICALILAILRLGTVAHKPVKNGYGLG
jgi:hypothetical protein